MRSVAHPGLLHDRGTTDPSALGAERFVSLTTFRRSGAGVPTPVWVAQDGDALVVITPSESGKVKRLRKDPRVELQPCGRTGRVAEGTPVTTGRAELVTDPEEAARLTALFPRKYRAEYRITMVVERVLARRQKPRLLVRIALEDSAGGSAACNRRH